MKPQLHVSGINTLYKCGVQYDYIYNQQMRLAPRIAMITGTATHWASKENLTAKRDTGLLLPLDAVKDIARDALNTEWERGVSFDADEAKEPEAKLRGDAVDKAVKLSACHATERAPEIEPVHLERPWVLDVPGLPFDLAGTIDIQESGRIIDIKTSGKAPASDVADQSLQLTAYSLAASVIDGEPLERVELHYLVATPKKVYAAEPLVSRRTAEDHNRLLLRVENAAKIIQSGAFLPAAPDSWACSEKWCGFFNVCSYARRPVSVAVKEVA